MSGPDPRIVALGGGHGLAASLRALRHVSDNLTAIVTVADDGGSSGRLRDEFGVLPPGDLRMALSALCEDTDWGHTWRDVLQHRFAGDGPLGGHALGNLLILALWELRPDPVAGLDLVARLLHARGRVVPMASVPLDISAAVSELDPDEPDTRTTLTGQARIATTTGRVHDIWLTPAHPPACPEALTAIHQADAIVLGPGSWFTSVLPHLLVPALRRALVATSARRVLTLNVKIDQGESRGLRAEGHLVQLHRIAPELRFDTVVADPSIIEDEQLVRAAARTLGADLVVTPVARTGAPGQHDTLRLAAAYADIMGRTR